MDTRPATAARHDRGEFVHRCGGMLWPGCGTHSPRCPAATAAATRRRPRSCRASARLCRNVSETTSPAAAQSAVSRKPRLQAARAYSSKSTPAGRGNCVPRHRPRRAVGIPSGGHANSRRRYGRQADLRPDFLTATGRAVTRSCGLGADRLAAGLVRARFGYFIVAAQGSAPPAYARRFALDRRG